MTTEGKVSSQIIGRTIQTEHRTTSPHYASQRSPLVRVVVRIQVRLGIVGTPHAKLRCSHGSLPGLAGIVISPTLSVSRNRGVVTPLRTARSFVTHGRDIPPATDVVSEYHADNSGVCHPPDKQTQSRTLITNNIMSLFSRPAAPCLAALTKLLTNWLLATYT